MCLSCQGISATRFLLKKEHNELINQTLKLWSHLLKYKRVLKQTVLVVFAMVNEWYFPCPVLAENWHSLLSGPPALPVSQHSSLNHKKNVKRPILFLTARIRLRLLKHTCSILQPCKSIVQLSYFYFMIYSKSRTDHTSLQPEVRNVFEAGCLSFRCHLQRVADTVISQGKWNDLIARFICVSNF